MKPASQANLTQVHSFFATVLFSRTGSPVTETVSNPEGVPVYSYVPAYSVKDKIPVNEGMHMPLLVEVIPTCGSRRLLRDGDTWDIRTGIGMHEDTRLVTDQEVAEIAREAGLDAVLEQMAARLRGLADEKRVEAANQRIAQQQPAVEEPKDGEAPQG